MRSREDRGAALIETVLVLGLLLVLVVGTVEYGMAYRGSMGLTASARAGARVGGSLGAAVDADCRILEATAAGLLGSSGDTVLNVLIFEYNPGTGTRGATNRYRPLSAGAVQSGEALVCGSWVRIGAKAFTELGRDDSMWLGVSVLSEHDWITGLAPFGGSIDLSGRSIMQVEPVNYGA